MSPSLFIGITVLMFLLRWGNDFLVNRVQKMYFLITLYFLKPPPIPEK